MVKAPTKVALGVLAVLATGVVLLGVGMATQRSGGVRQLGLGTSSGSSAMDSGPAPKVGPAAGPAQNAASGSTGGSVDSAQPVAAAGPPSTEPMVITTASMALTVKDVSASVDSARRIVAGLGGSIANLSVSTGQAGPAPLASDAASVGSASRQPSSADLTVRVPAARLAEAQAKLGALGTIDAQGETQSDVTQQHIDLSARLKNLRAEEARVRSFLGQSSNVREMLDIERELTRIRGDIESMQAQVDYLERQAAMATFTLSLAQPGALIRPAASNWGLGESVTEGVQAAVGLVRVMTTGAIAISPLIVLAFALWLGLRLARRARGRHNGGKPAEVV